MDGLQIKDGSKRILEILTESGRLLGHGSISHSYPHCWRCKKPVIFRSRTSGSSQCRIFALKPPVHRGERALDSGMGQGKIYNMVRDRSDWCISRQRIWGVPIPAFYCDDCETRPHRRPDSCGTETCRGRRLLAWWSKTPEDLLGDLCFCPHCGGKHLTKEKDIMDVWFDSGSSHAAVLKVRPELKWPADMYLEGSDQHRGWFQTSLLTSVGMYGRPPYEQVLTHGFIVDGDGKKMSKSLGNVVAPQEVINEYGRIS